jgi:hypothetical protein
MSVGDLKTEGNKGNNFPYQLKVLQGLQCVCDQLKELNVDTTAIEATLQQIETNTTGTLKTPQYVVASNFAGTINVAVTSISFANNSSVDADITVDGVNYNVLPAGVTVNFDAGAIGNYYAANTFAYDTLSYPGSSIIIIYNEF